MNVVRIVILVQISGVAHCIAAIHTVAITGDPLPEGPGQFLSFTDAPAINNSGVISFHALHTNTGAQEDDSGIYLYDGIGINKIVRDTDDTPDGNGAFGVLAPGFNLNNAGQIAFRAYTPNDAIYFYNGASIVKIAREEDYTPDGDAQFRGFGCCLLNESGAITFSGELNVNSQDDFGIYRFSGNVVEIVREGDVVPDGDGNVDGFGFTRLNNMGMVLLPVTLKNTGSTSNDTAIYLDDSSLTKLLREGDPSPDDDGDFGELHQLRAPDINDSGEVVYVVESIGAGGGMLVHIGNELTSLVRSSDPVPEDDVSAGVKII